MRNLRSHLRRFKKKNIHRCKPTQNLSKCSQAQTQRPKADRGGQTDTVFDLRIHGYMKRAFVPQSKRDAWSLRQGQSLFSVQLEET